MYMNFFLNIELKIHVLIDKIANLIFLRYNKLLHNLTKVFFIVKAYVLICANFLFNYLIV